MADRASHTRQSLPLLSHSASDFGLPSTSHKKETPHRTPPRVGSVPGAMLTSSWSMECPGLPESLGHAHEAVSMAPKSLAQHHLRFISWNRGGDQRGPQKVCVSSRSFTEERAGNKFPI